jgi:hypothetical protein
MHTFINTVSLRHVSVLKGPSSKGTSGTFKQQGQQNELPDVKFTIGAKYILFVVYMPTVFIAV